MEDSIYDKISPSLVKLVFKEGQEEIIIPGIITMSGDDYCYIIAFATPKLQSVLPEVVLPDGGKMQLQKEDVQKEMDLIGFYADTSAQMKSVDFRENISMNEEIYSFVFDNQVVSSICHMSHGRVTFKRKFEFSHDASPGPLTPHGGLVFNKEAEFVGISFKDRGVTVVHDVSYIRKILALLHGKMTDTPLGELLQYIDGVAKSRKNKKTGDKAKSPKKRKRKSR